MSKASVYFTLSSLGNSHDAKAIKRELDTLPGVQSVSISDHSNCVAVDYDTIGVQPARIEKQLELMGYHVLDCKKAAADSAP